MSRAAAVYSAIDELESKIETEQENAKLLDEIVERHSEKLKSLYNTYKDVASASVNRTRQVLSLRATELLARKRLCQTFGGLQCLKSKLPPKNEKKSSALAAFDRMEKIVVEKEKRAERYLRPNAVVESTFDRLERRVAENEKNAELESVRSRIQNQMELESTISDWLEKPFSVLRSVKAKPLEFLRRRDPSLERSFSRLEKQLADAKAALETSQLAGERLSVHYQLMVGREKQTTSDVESERGEAMDVRLTYGTGLADVAETLSAITKRNIFAQDQLFYVEAIANRLHVIMLLLSALPSPLSTDMKLWFLRMIEELGSFLSNTDAKDLRDINYHDEVGSYEFRVIMMYIQIAKGSAEPLSKREQGNMQKLIPQISTQLETERTKLLDQCMMWEQRTETAKQAEQNFVFEVAEQRRAYCAGVLKTIEQSIEALTLVVSRMEPSPAPNEQ